MTTNTSLQSRVNRLEQRRRPAVVRVCWGDCVGPCPLCNPDVVSEPSRLITWPEEEKHRDD